MKKRMQILDATALKLIAMVFMVIDHVGDNFFPEQTWMRIVGRIAMPLFSFCTAEALIHTRDRMKYLLRLLVFALVSEIPFDLVTSGKVLEFGHQNIMFTFAYAVIGIMIHERITGNGKTANKVFGLLFLMAYALASILLGLDYNAAAVGIIFVYYLLRDRDLWFRNGAAAALHLVLRNVGIYLYGLLGFIPIFFYNGKRGRGLKWLFYGFYPGHLLLIYLLKQIVQINP